MGGVCGEGEAAPRSPGKKGVRMLLKTILPPLGTGAQGAAGPGGTARAPCFAAARCKEVENYVRAEGRGGRSAAGRPGAGGVSPGSPPAGLRSRRSSRGVRALRLVHPRERQDQSRACRAGWGISPSSSSSREEAALGVSSGSGKLASGSWS